MSRFFVAAVFIIVAISIPTFTESFPLQILHRYARQLKIPKELGNIRFENYFKNPRAVRFQLNCLVYDGPCDAIGKYVKNNMESWIHTNCENCDDEQKKLAGRLIGFFQRGYPREWNDAVRKYRGEFSSDETNRFEEELGLPLYVDEPEDGGPGKIDFDGLVGVLKEGKELLKATKTPIVLSQGGVQLTTPRGFDADALFKRVEALAEKHLPAIKDAVENFKLSGPTRASRRYTTTTKTTTTTTTPTTTTTTTTESPMDLVTEFETETPNPQDEETTTTMP